MKRKLLCILLSTVLLLGLLPGMQLQASAASEMKASDDCIAMLKAMEGFSAKPYWDYSQYSVGYGTACPSEADRNRYEAEGISEEEAEALLRKYVQTSEQYLNERIIDKFSVPLNQNQFDALVLFTYNCGTGWINDSTSSFRSAVINGATGNDFLYPISRWCVAGGSVQKFLLDRRMKEANVYLNGIYSTAVPENYSYVRYNGNGGTVSSSVQGYDVNDSVAPIATATNGDSQFAGWFTEKEGGTKVTALDASVKGCTLYAHWGEETADSPETSSPETSSPETSSPETSSPETSSPETSSPETSNPAPQPDDTAGTSVKIKVTGDFVNIRKGPGTGYGVTSTVSAGKELTITETAEGSGYNWGKFSGGWICLKYTNYDSVVKAENETVQPEDETPEQDPVVDTPKTQMGTIQVDTTLRIRSGAGTSYSITGYLSSGTKVEILEQSNVNGTAWGKISKGWICMDYVKLDSTTSDSNGSTQTPDADNNTGSTETPKTDGEDKSTVVATGKVIDTNELRIRSAAGTNNSILGYLTMGTKVEIYERTTVGSMVWGRIDKGWISLDYIQLDSNQSTTVIATGSVINTNSLRIRSAAGTSNAILGYLTMGTRVEIYERMSVGSMIWGRIDKGWISLDYIKLDSDGTGSDSGTNFRTVNTSSLRIRSGAGTNNSIVGYLTMGERVEILEQTTVNGTPWGRTSKGWICLDYVI